MPYIGKLLRPESVAVVRASSDLQGLRGRILELIELIPSRAGTDPVSRSGTDVQVGETHPLVGHSPQSPTSQS